MLLYLYYYTYEGGQRIYDSSIYFHFDKYPDDFTIDIKNRSLRIDYKIRRIPNFLKQMNTLRQTTGTPIDRIPKDSFPVIRDSNGKNYRIVKFKKL